MTYIVSAGKAFNDIDAFGCAIAYSELLRKEGKEARTVFIGALNHSVTPLALEQSAEYLLSYTPTPDDRLIYVDLSDPEHFAFPGLPESQIFEIYDHHYGFEEHWRELLGDRSHIERVGAAATLIWEEFKKRGQEKEISATSANLLALAILQNTLNFCSTESNERDVRAFEELTPHLSMQVDWQQRYFAECAEAMRVTFGETLRNDSKVLERFFGEMSCVFAQLEVSEDPVQLLAQHKSEVDDYFAMFPNARRLLNIPDMSSKTSLLYSDDTEWLHAEVETLFPEVLQTSDHWILIPILQRKQIFKLFREKMERSD